uniref:Uncharacterized protein n=1 Tax=Sarcopeltis skottsbergii TaxID=2765380 RepID=A0A7M1VIC9_SARSK|nr:hypothetical protein [Sarcopeltis skottsbergii]
MYIINNMNINFQYQFHKVLFLPVNKKNYHKNNFIPISWELLLKSDGSFTQDLNSLTGQLIQVEILSLYNNIKVKNDYTIREVWIKDQQGNKLAFAKSIWPRSMKKHLLVNLPTNQPIGQSLIQFKIDIHKDIHEIFYGYCQYLEKHFNYNGPMWGRKYTLYYENKKLATVQEIFSPQILKLFHSTTL